MITSFAAPDNERSIYRVEELTPEEEQTQRLQADLGEHRVKRFVYQCVFAPVTGCGADIEPDGGHPLDPCTVVLTTDWRNDKEGREDNWQQWWCHLNCFIKATGRSVDDLGLRDEMQP